MKGEKAAIFLASEALRRLELLQVGHLALPLVTCFAGGQWFTLGGANSLRLGQPNGRSQLTAVHMLLPHGLPVAPYTLDTLE